MRFAVWSLTVAAVILTGRAVSAQDHLIPELGSLNDLGVDLAGHLRRDLFKGAEFDHYRARVVCVPSFKPAWAATLVCDDEDGDRSASYSILYAELEGRVGVELERADVQRLRANIDREAAEAVQRVWLTVLRGVRHPKQFVSGADGITYHFSRFVARISDDPIAPRGWETGWVWTPRPGSPPGRLAALADRLRAYAKASPEERPRIRDAILKEASALQNDLDRRRTQDTGTRE
jgi:hypothetical protein